MVRKSRRIFTVVFMLLFAVTMLFTSFADTAWAENGEEEMTPKEKALSEASSNDGDEEDKEYVHRDITTFEKNFDLTVDQKIYTITEIEKVVDEIIDPEMSDLEKYYTLACWVNNRVKYDGDFWNGGYNFDYYSHQWDSYGGMKEGEYSVCVGISIFYATMCHAADLPCRFVRLIPEYLDHTINYIPDINGNAYYADVTENVFLMSDKSGDSFTENADKEFAHITKDATDNSFDYTDSEGKLNPPDLVKARNDDNSKVYAPYDEWFNEYALHKNTDKKFDTPYVENGSGLRSTETGYKHASYTDSQYYPSQHFLDAPDIWFLDDFYRNPAETKEKIRNGKFEEQFLNVSGVKKNYDCDSEEDLVAEVSKGMSIEYFPSWKDGEIVAEATQLTRDQDYEVRCTKFDPESRTAELEISGRAWYDGSFTIPVKLHTAAVDQAPVIKKDLTYNGDPQELIEPGIAETGEMQYALGTETEPTEEFTPSVPTAVDAGEYFVWYKAVGDDAHWDSEMQRMERSVKIAKIDLFINCKSKTIQVGKTVTLNPKVENGMPATFTYECGNNKIATVNSKGVVKGLKPGDAQIYIHANPKNPNPNYNIYDGFVEIEVVKGSNPMKLKPKTVNVNYKALKKKAKVISRKKAFTVSKQQGKLSYKLVSAKKGSKKFNKQFRVNAKSGKVTVKKGLKKGTYKVTVRVKAKGNSSYKASAWKKVTFKVKIK